MRIVEEDMYKGHLYQIAEDRGRYKVSWDCGNGVGNYTGSEAFNTLEEATDEAKQAIDCYVDRYVDDILLFGEGIKVGATLYSHSTHEKCKVIEFNGSTMTVKFDNGDTQEFGSDYAFDVIDDSDAAQFDIVCEGRTENGMKFQIVTDNQNKDKGYGFAVDIWPCFNEDYTQYTWNFSTIHAVIDWIESEYSKDADKLKLLKVGEYALIRRIGHSESELIQVMDIDKDTIYYRCPGVVGVHTGDISHCFPLSAKVIPWTPEELNDRVGCYFKAHNITYMATGYDGNLNALLIPKVSGVAYVTADALIMDGYEMKTEEGWKPCYNVKWEE